MIVKIFSTLAILKIDLEKYFMKLFLIINVEVF